MRRYHFPTPLSVALGFKGALLAVGLRASLPASRPGRQILLIYDKTDAPHLALTVRSLGSKRGFELWASVDDRSPLKVQLDQAWRQFTSVSWTRIVLVYGRRRTRPAA